MGFTERAKYIYEHEYKKLLIIPFILLLLAVAQIGYQVATTGDFVQRSVSLKGGVSITSTNGMIDIQQFEQEAKKISSTADFSTRTLRNTNQIIIEVSGITEEQTLQILSQQNIKKENVVIEATGSSLGKSFFTATLGALALSFLFMSIVVAIAFRTAIPSLAVRYATVSNMSRTLAI